MDKLWNQYPGIKADLEMVLAIMKKNVKCRQKIVETTLLELIESGGKLLRPAFVILASKFGNIKSDNVTSLAAVIEMLHMATLVHDDVIDDSQLRRGRETIQSKYGKNFAVYAGDFLFCSCFKILSSTSSLKTINIDSNTMSRICVGEIEQYSSKFNENVTVKQYLKRISAKTAELFSLSFYTGATEVKCDKKLVNQLASIGHNIGMAFQIIDDILDYTGDEKTVGKTTCNDLKQGIYTLPLIFSLETKNKALLKLLSKKEFNVNDIDSIIKITEEDGSIDKARKLAKQYTKKAFSKINALPDNESKLILNNITELLLKREY